MPSIFTRIIQGEIPGRILHEDEHCFAMLDIRPLHPGHTLVIPKDEVDQWTELSTELAGHLMGIAHRIAVVQKRTIPCERIGLMIAGFEVPHTHVHVVPLQSMANLDFRNAEVSPKADELDAMATLLRSSLGE